jgi:uncharacterized protein (TIGR02145 family)
MKQKILYPLIMMCFMMDVFSQNTTITLTFQALDSATLFPVALDSVTVFNLTENCDTTLYDSVSVLTMNATWPVRIEEQGSPGPGMMTVRQNSPNPFHGTTRVSLFLNIDAELNMTLSDNSGKTCAGHRKVYPKGWHLFTISTKESGLFFLRVIAGDVSKTIRIVSAGGNDQTNRISYSGQTNPTIHPLKDGGDQSGFIFYLGNFLRYTAYSGGYNPLVIVDNPVDNEIYTFEMAPVPFVCGSSQVAYEGKNYNTVMIGTQCWLKENLNAGVKIDGLQNQTNNGIIEKYCYDNLETNCDIYGGLYQWNEMMQYVTQEGTQGICPDGWHLPTTQEWNTLLSFLGGGTTAGGAMKETGTAHWLPPNAGATNSSGFTALGAGFRRPIIPPTSGLKENAMIWSSTEAANNGAWQIQLYFDMPLCGLFANSNTKPGGSSVRCLKN